MTEGEGKAGSGDDATEPPSPGLTPVPDPAATPVTYGTTHTTSPRLNVIQQAEWTGPMPDPVSLGEFDRIVPGLAARMADEWEAEAAFRRGYMTTQAKHERRMEWAGLQDSGHSPSSGGLKSLANAGMCRDSVPVVGLLS